MIAINGTVDRAQQRAVLHVVGQSRALAHRHDYALNEIGSIDDERTARLVEAMRLTLRELAGPGTLRHIGARAYRPRLTGLDLIVNMPFGYWTEVRHLRGIGRMGALRLHDSHRPSPGHRVIGIPLKCRTSWT